jgi:hypothetical protein
MAWSEIQGNLVTRERTKNGLPHEVSLTELAKAQPTPRPGRSLVFGSGAGASTNNNSSIEQRRFLALPVRLESVPILLKDLPNWILWKYE